LAKVVEGDLCLRHPAQRICDVRLRAEVAQYAIIDALIRNFLQLARDRQQMLDRAAAVRAL
jgi:hypothetical protein